MFGLQLCIQIHFSALWGEIKTNYLSLESYSILRVVSEKSGATLDELLMPEAKLIQKEEVKKLVLS